jgi:hypothetical protein
MVDGQILNTSQMVLGNFYIDDRDMKLPDSIGEGTYPLKLAVYQWWDQKRITAPGVDANTQLLLQMIYIHSWS